MKPYHILLQATEALISHIEAVTSICTLPGEAITKIGMRMSRYLCYLFLNCYTQTKVVRQDKDSDVQFRQYELVSFIRTAG